MSTTFARMRRSREIDFEVDVSGRIGRRVAPGALAGDDGRDGSTSSAPTPTAVATTAPRWPGRKPERGPDGPSSVSQPPKTSSTPTTHVIRSPRVVFPCVPVEPRCAMRVGSMHCAAAVPGMRAARESQTMCAITRAPVFDGLDRDPSTRRNRMRCRADSQVRGAILQCNGIGYTAGEPPTVRWQLRPLGDS